MLDTAVSWLDGIGALAFTVSAWAFVGLNGFALAMLARTRDRALVNRWTSAFLAVNLVLLGTGLGVPLATFATRTALVALSPALSVLAPGQPEADSLMVPERVRP
jgi:hypothetical protein